jgi:hypothetical protein
MRRGRGVDGVIFKMVSPRAVFALATRGKYMYCRLQNRMCMMRAGGWLICLVFFVVRARVCKCVCANAVVMAAAAPLSSRIFFLAMARLRGRHMGSIRSATVRQATLSSRFKNWYIIK